MKSHLALVVCVCTITISLVAAAWCGNHECEPGENCSWCAYDCGTCESWQVFKHCVNSSHYVISFDDGPNQWTDGILDALKAKGAVATFFFLGSNADQYKDRMKRAWQEGHSIGTHTLDHLDLETMSMTTAINDVLGMVNQVQQMVGMRPVWFRPPFGSFTKELNDQLILAGQRVVLWNLDPVDWQNPLATQMQIYQSALNATDFGGLISVQHGMSQDAQTAIGLAIDMVRERGYTIVSMEECAGFPNVTTDPSWLPPADPNASVMNAPNMLMLASVLLFLFCSLL